MASLFVELLSEELPALMQLKAGEAFLKLVLEGFASKGIDGLQGQFYTGPRRLVLTVKGLPFKSPDQRAERRGPHLEASQEALEGFLKSQGALKEDLKVRQTSKGSFYFLSQLTAGEKVEHLIPSLMEKAIKALPWPVSMMWGWGTVGWVRPLQSVVCLLEDKPVSFTLSFGDHPEAPCVTSHPSTMGHRFLSSGPLAIKDEQSYWSTLERSYVMVDHRLRQEKIWQGALRLANAKNLRVVEDEKLLQEVTGLAEWPVVMMGTIDPSFMALPQDVLMTSMRVHQRYFAVKDKEGRLAPYFIFVANIPGQADGKEIIKGNERVLTARLSDALFFYKQDCNIPLESHVAELKKVTFHRALGNMAEKTTRLQGLAQWLAARWGTDVEEALQASRFLKADLLTGMVGEFPELQGIMGAYYARHQGKGEAVSKAIQEHYLPKLLSDPCPSSFLGTVMAVADRVDTLTGFFAMGIQPTGSKDPFALRRAMVGLIRILEKGQPLILKEAFEKAYDLYQVPLQKGLPQTQEALSLFLNERLKVYWQAQGFSLDVIGAVIGFCENSSLATVRRRLEALQSLKGDDSDKLLSLYKRVANILGEGESSFSLHPQAFREEAERELFRQLQVMESAIHESIAQEDFLSAFHHLQKMEAPMDIFFEKILVNDPDLVCRQNRLALMKRVKILFEKVACFAALEEATNYQRNRDESVPTLLPS